MPASPDEVAAFATLLKGYITTNSTSHRTTWQSYALGKYPTANPLQIQAMAVEGRRALTKNECKAFDNFRAADSALAAGDERTHDQHFYEGWRAVPPPHASLPPVSTRRGQNPNAHGQQIPAIQVTGPEGNLYAAVAAQPVPGGRQPGYGQQSAYGQQPGYGQQSAYGQQPGRH